jgi:hypothetical protein
MERKHLLAAALAVAFAFPLAASAGGTEKHKTSGAKSAEAPAQTASTNGANDGGAEAMFKSLDKNGDGILTKEETMGTPHHANFDKLDKNRDGKLSRDEHSAAPDHVAARSKEALAANPSPTPGEKKTY